MAASQPPSLPEPEAAGLGDAPAAHCTVTDEGVTELVVTFAGAQGGSPDVAEPEALPDAPPEAPPDAELTPCALPPPPPLAVSPVPLNKKLDDDPAEPLPVTLAATPAPPAPTVTL